MCLFDGSFVVVTPPGDRAQTGLAPFFVRCGGSKRGNVVIMIGRQRQEGREGAGGGGY